MDIEQVRQALTSKTIFDLPLNVTYYARVSSEKDEQLNSLDNQISYYENYIRQNKNWTFVSGYIDEGISGISTEKRENFNRLIDDAKEHKFDLVITKEISRFARNTLDSIRYTRELLRSGVGVFFQNDNINTLDGDAELRLTIMSSLAQDEIRKLSSRVKFGHQQAIKSGVVLGNSRIFGYIKQNKRLVIDEAQAEIVRVLFELYSTNEYSMKQLETLFWNKGCRNYNGNKIAHTTMSGIISNPKYKGYYVGNKVRIVDMFTKKQKFLPPEEWVMFKDETGEIVPAIVSEELWEKANAILRRRSDDVKSRQGVCSHSNLLTGKLICTCCGVPYYRKESKGRNGEVNSKWICSGKINNGYDSCDSVAIYESEIKPVLFDVLSDTEASSKILIEQYIEMYKSLDENSDAPKLIAAQKKIIETAQKKKSKLLELAATGDLPNKDFLAMNRQCSQEIDSAEHEIFELEAQQNSKEEFRRHIDNIRKVLLQAEKDAKQNMISRDFVEKYIDKIFVTPQDNGTIRLDIKIFTGESTSRYLEKLEGRTGHTFKKMIQAYENSIK